MLKGTGQMISRMMHDSILACTSCFCMPAPPTRRCVCRYKVNPDEGEASMTAGPSLLLLRALSCIPECRRAMPALLRLACADTLLISNRTHDAALPCSHRVKASMC